MHFCGRSPKNEDPTGTEIDDEGKDQTRKFGATNLAQGEGEDFFEKRIKILVPRSQEIIPLNLAQVGPCLKKTNMRTDETNEDNGLKMLAYVKYVKRITTLL